MKTHLLVLVLCICSIQMFYSQEDGGVVALNIPLRNSLTYNRFNINPTFSFVREQDKFISVSNKREWVQFDNAPLTYFASYSGRFGENTGAGVGVFQQNYGVLTTFGGILNFAYNARLQRDSNLTFGINIGAYKSGLNTGKVVVNFDDPSLQNIPENFLITANPAINYGTGFFDFGIAAKNLIAYNLESSAVIEDNPEKGIQAHIMYTGYLRNRGFFDESKFSGLVKSEFKKGETIISGMAMLTVPKGIWAQVGYNTVYGVSGGIGLNITPKIAVEYNYEKAIGNLSNFGSSHEFTLAYRFKNKENYEYSSGDEVSSLLSSDNRRRRRKPRVSKPVVSRETIAERKAKLLAEQKAQEEADAQAILLAQQKAQEEADAQAILLAQQKAQEEADAQARLLAEQKAQEEADARARLLAEQKAQEETDAQARLLAEQKAQEEADAQARLLAEQKAQEEADAQARLLAEQKAQEEADAQARLLAEQKAQEETDAQARLLAEQKAQEEADAQARLLAEQKAQEEADAQARLLAEQKAQEEADAQARLLAEQKAQEEADAQARLLAQQKAQEEADAQARLLAEQKAQEEKDQLILNPTDALGKNMLDLTEQTEESKTIQNELLKRFDAIVEVKNDDLKSLKEENDLSEEGISVAPKPFKSISEENNRLKAIISDLDNVIKNRSSKIKELKSLYDDKFEADTINIDGVNLYYRKTIKRLELEQKEAIDTKVALDAKLEDIQVATEYERRRRIKRAAFDNEEERYTQDRATLQNIKKTVTESNDPIKSEDFDFGEKQSDNIQILKNVKNTENGYYLILAVHNNKEKRDDFITKVIQSGNTNVDFFYDVNTSKYFIFANRYDSNSISEVTNAIESKGDKAYNINMSIVKIEN